MGRRRHWTPKKLDLHRPNTVFRLQDVRNPFVIQEDLMRGACTRKFRKGGRKNCGKARATLPHLSEA